MVTVKKLLAVHDTNKSNPANLPTQYYKLFFSCKIVSGDLKPSYETSQLAYFPLDNLPRLSEKRNTFQQIETCVKPSSDLPYIE